MNKMSCFSGKDKTVVLWSIQDHIASATSDSSTVKSFASGGSIADGPSVGPRGIYCGHDDTVEDVAFCPSR